MLKPLTVIEPSTGTERTSIEEQFVPEVTLADQSLSKQVYFALTSDDAGRVCKDIPEEACKEQPRNFLIHVVSLAATKIGDGLVDPKLVLSWLLGVLGAPAYLIGLLVPLRESGALVPQLFLASTIRTMARRKWVWAAGSLVQGLCVAGMAASAVWLQGVEAGWAIVTLLGIFAIARSACSVSYKDVLGKTVSKNTRGTVTGTASSLAAALVLGFGILLSTGLIDKSTTTIAGALLVASSCWIAAALLFIGMPEHAGATAGGGNPLSVAFKQLGLLKRDPQLVRFIATRGLLVATALAPPFLVTLAGRGGDAELGQLGAFVIASALASVGSTYIWGRLSDVSSRKVLSMAAAAGALALTVAAALGWLAPERLQNYLVGPALLFVLMIAYQGVRLGRSTHIVDMADEQTRASYTAISNTIVGVLLMLGSGFGLLAVWAGEAAVLCVFALMCFVAVFSALTLEEVQ